MAASKLSWRVNEFLLCETPGAWLEHAAREEKLLLIDHANCEKKAASTALNLMYRYVDKSRLMRELSRLAREELRHFEQVLAIVDRRGYDYVHVSPSRYAGALRKLVRTHEPARLVDILIVSALVEARSCERFEKLRTVMDEELSDFYGTLLKSEARHFELYLEMARQFADEPIDDRTTVFLARERELIESTDPEYRFHSGVPV